MKICVVSPSYPTPKTIVFVFVDQLCRAFADLGHQVTVIAPQSLTRCLIHREPLAPKNSVIKTEKATMRIYRPYTFTFGNGRFHQWTRRSFERAVIKTFEKQKLSVDVCYGHFWSSIKALQPISEKFDIPLFGASGEENITFYCSNYTNEIKDSLKKNLRGLISVSTKNKNECISLGLVTEDKVRVIPNAVNLSIFKNVDRNAGRKMLGLKPDDFAVAFLGQFVPRKGTLRLNKALKLISDKNVKAVFVGQGVENPDYEGIIFKGRLEHKDIPLYLSACDVLVLPTENEGCSNAIIEAMACGLPIISTDADFNKDVLNESNSILIDCHNVEDIASAIKRIKEDKNLRKQLSNGSLVSAAALSIEERANKIVDFINQR